MIEALVAKLSLTGLTKVVKSAACMVGKQALERGTKEALDTAFSSALGVSLANLTVIEQALFALDLSKPETDALEEFLSSPCFESFIRAIGLLAIASPSALSSEQAALTEFLAKVLPERTRGAIESLSAAIIEFVSRVAPDAWETAVSLGVLGKSWSTETIIQGIVADEISNTRNQLEQKIASNSAALHEVDTFAERYKRAVKFATSKVKPQAINESQSVPIADLYVEPLVNFETEKGVKPCHRDMLFASSRRSVLLGNPGGGKSTLAGKLCHDISADLLDKSTRDAPELSAQVVLRDYAQEQRLRPSSIIEYLEAHSKREFQIEAPPGAFRLLLVSGRILIVFDGLDELIEIKDRSDVCSAVAHFALEYPVAPILVTSREVGYEQAPLDRAQFSHYNLNPFGDEQIKEYANKWFRYTCHPNAEEGNRLSAAFIAESAVVPDIRSNPLMLGLLCNLYRQDGFIPKNRPDVYQRCADLLFTRWDRSRGIHIKLPLEHRLRPAMSYLAHWIYSDEQLQTGVTENHLILKTSEYLRQWVEDDAEAEKIAREFVTFFRGRAWVFTDTGSDRTQRLYQFTHRTFLEYFTADELVRVHSRAADLHEHLIDRIRTRSWDVVCQLAFQLIAQRTLSHNLLVESLCEDARVAGLSTRLYILSFLARTMDLLYPMPTTRRDAVRLCVRTVFENLPQIEIDEANSKSLSLEILGGVLGATEEALKINASEMSSTLETIVKSEVLPLPAKCDAMTLIGDLSMLYGMATQSSYDERRSFWSEQSELLLGRIEPVVKSLEEVDYRIAALSWWGQRKPSLEILRTVGVMGIFSPVPFPLGNWIRGPIGTVLTRWPLDNRFERTAESPDSSEDKWKNWVTKEVISISKPLLESNPWKVAEMTQGFGPWHDPIITYVRMASEKNLKWPNDQHISEGVLVCLAFAVEIELKETTQTRPNVHSEEFDDLAAFCHARLDESARERAHSVVEARCNSKLVKEKLHSWIQGHTSFITRGV
jgi:hypothetical protein